MSDRRLHYEITMEDRSAHLFHVTLEVEGGEGEFVDLQMPAWGPGHYRIDDHAKNLLHFRATDPAGEALDWEKRDKHTWRVRRGAGAGIRVAYDLFANEEGTPYYGQLNYHQGFLNGVMFFLYVVGAQDRPATIRITPPDHWQVATSLEPTDDPHLFRAPDFDTLADCMVVCGTLDILPFEARGVPHRLVFSGPGNYDREKVVTDVRKICENQLDLFGGAPFTDYTFFYLLYPNGGGGIEHANSTAIACSSYGFSDPDEYNQFLMVTSHEYFHLWNVKRIRPVGLGPFDYTREAYTTLLYLSEGFTSYYEFMAIRRGGVWDRKTFCKELVREIGRHWDDAGRNWKSLEAYSWDAWLQSDHPFNTIRTYYLKGAMVGLCMDLELRRRTGGARSLDDVMRLLNERFARRNRNLSDADFQAAVEEVAGGSFDEFFARYIRGTEEIDFDQVFAPLGLRLTPLSEEEAKEARWTKLEKRMLRPLGIRFKESGGRMVVQVVEPDGPARAAGVEEDDELLALDGLRVEAGSIRERIKERGYGEPVPLAVFRDNRLHTLTITPVEPRPAYRLEEDPDAPPEAVRLRDGWLGP